MQEKKVSPLYRAMKAIVRRIYPPITLIGAEHLPDEPVILVSNHAQIHGPIAFELYAPEPHYTWCIAQMMHLKEVPAYAYQDFWSKKPRIKRPFYKLLSYLIAPLSVHIFNNGNSIAVYHDSRILSTFRETVQRLEDGANIVIFPEQDEDYNHILCRFQDKFIDVAKLYYRKTGKELSFVPVYLAPTLHTMSIGTPIPFHADTPFKEERTRLCETLMQEITALACDLPRHTVVPYRNLPKKDYPVNLPNEVTKR